MNGAARNSQGRFFHRFCQCGVRMRSTGQVFGRTTKFHQHGNFVDKLTRLRTDDVCTQYSIGFGVSENFGKAIRGLIGLGAGVGAGWPAARVEWRCR